MNFGRPKTPVTPNSKRGSPNGDHDRFWPVSPKSDSGLSSEMLDAKLTRKKAEADLQLLANRVALLKAEEHKALTKVEETRQRSTEILQIKKRNESVLQAKIQASIAKEQQVRDNQAKAQAEREERQRKISMSKKYINDSRKALVGEAKEEKKRLNDIVYQGRSIAEMEKHAKAEEIRSRRNATLQERERVRIEKEQQSQMLYLKRVHDEAQRRREAEDMINRLEQEEKELIGRLQRTQELQEKAFSTLQSTLRP